MGHCDKCGEYSECLHPVSFISELSRLMNKLDLDLDTVIELNELERRIRDEEGRGIYLGHSCLGLYDKYIVWWG